MIFAFIFMSLLLSAFCIFRLKGECRYSGKLDYHVTKYSKTIMMLAVISHHLSQTYATGEGWLASSCENILQLSGPSLCAAFFFFSGYGLIYSIINKKQYVYTMPNRILSILIPYVIANAVYALIRLHEIWPIIAGEAHTNQQLMLHVYSVVRNWICGFALVSFAWFVDQIIIFYCLFYVCNKLLTVCKAIIVQSIIISILLVVLAKLGAGSWTYNSSIAFLFGQIFAYGIFKCKGLDRLLTFFISAITISMLIYCMKTILVAPVGITEIVGYSLRIIPFIVVLTMFTARKNRFMDFLSARSFDIYMYQGISFLLILQISIPTPIKCVCILFASILFGCLFYFADAKLVKFVISKFGKQLC